MRLAMIGTGYVGLVSGACFAEFGIEVTCVDKDAAKIEKLKQGIIPIFEPGLEDLVAKQVKAGRLSFTTQLASSVEKADVVFIAVGTPPRASDGHADLQYVYAAAREVVAAAKGYTVIVTKSTVPVGTAREVEKIVKEGGKEGQIDVCSNPEFLREGAAVNDFMRPDRVVIGTDSARAVEVMKEVYRPLYINETPMVVTSPESSEIIKYAANAFLATKISFINEIADLCEASGGNVQDVSKAMGLDGRIGSKFLHAGPGYGGSCFPKDTLALTHTGELLGAPQRIVESVVQVNNNRQKKMAQRVIEACGGDVSGMTIAVLGVAFKPNTDDVRDAPSLVIIPALQQAGATIVAHDPEAREEAQKQLHNITWADEAYAAAQNADAVVIITEWNEYRALNLKRIGDSMKTKRLIDLRNIYKPHVMNELGFHYVSIGRPDVLSKQFAEENKTLKVVS
ncbi:MAG: UDP-glucose/GDP-mannose dehydrogenase family protein [Alphaproteobacteria bacterium]|nr:UDP-glucose/GDP-mannose dehydrogenase family protein [Alphaproteobacteria bacterium]NCQ88773.1 UDP-glucose/GDP-mannose dehydrogenase family protein [Alphaproteobacteria bacterium]NCT07304.1 UDP-glucose/GDP-mannose dehydrogenase family protein [Alphaproteobacteria bacterium]